MALISDKRKESIWFHLLVMLLLAMVFYIIFFTSLGRITGHGKELKMPVLINMNFNDALKLLEKQGFEVDVDSTFDMRKPSGAVLSQIPDTGQFVKKGRTVFLIVNKNQPPLTPMPDLAGVSYRSADIVLKSNKLRLGDTVHRPDIANGAILEALYKGKVVKEGDMIPQGSPITLVIGDGLGNVEFDVPDVMGMAYPEAIAILNASGLQFIDLWEGRITDSQTAVVYYQYPEAKNEFGGVNTIKEGQLIDIKIRQTAPTTELQQGNKSSRKQVPTERSNGTSDDYN